MTHLSVFLLAVLFSCAIAQEFNAPTQQNTQANEATFLPPTQQQQQQVPQEQPQQIQQNQQNPPAEQQLRAPIAGDGAPLQTTPNPPRRTPPRRDGDAICNPLTGIRARGGGIYAGLLNRMGVQAGNCGGGRGRQQQNNQEGGTVNPITGIRARRGGIYERLLNGAGVRNNQGNNNQNNNNNNNNQENNLDNNQGNNRGNNNQNNQEGGTVNPITGIRARRGGIYERLLNGVGVNNNNQGNQGGNNNNQGNQGGNNNQDNNQGGTVNPITGIRARQGGIYQRLLNGAGVNNNGNQEGAGGLLGLGNNPLVRFINANGGLIAAADQNTNAPAITPAQSAVPSWAVAGAVLLSVLIVGTIAVMVQVVVLIRSS